MKRLIIFLFLLTILFVLAGCVADMPPTAAPAPAEPAKEAAPTEEPTAVPPTVAPTETPEPTAEPTAAPTAEPTPTTAPTAEPATLSANLTDSCVTEYDETVDYFPQKAVIEYASGFTIEYFNNYKVLTIPTPWQGAEEGVQYVLVQCGTPPPEGYAEATIVEVPVQSFVSMSTTYLPYVDQYGLIDRLVGVDNAAFISNENIRAKYDAGELAEIGSGGEVNVETAVDLNPDLIMTSASGFAEYDAHPKLAEAGLTVALNADYLDTTPLGQAEWGKYLAAFFNQEGAATEQFAEVVARYEALTALTADLAERPTVFNNTPFDGTWYMPGGNSYVAQLLADAGADYLWADDESTGSLFLDFETVFDRAAGADYWINIGFFATLDDLAAADERFTEFAAYQNGNVYNNDARVNEFGGNDYYESGAANPHLVLADLIRIFHPDLLPDYELYYYRQVE